ncbi:MAG: glycosyltransferase, partial [bacterium]|nr:glycosyltransferase [bacterium]
MEDIQFSLCAIYKNEEKNLEIFLRRHIDLFDEFVLVDTGSTDRSNEIVESFGLSHYFFPWVDDFSKARNFSLTKAGKSFIVVLDMDEHVLKEDFLRLKTIIRETGKDVYSLVQVNFTGSREDLSWKSIETLPEAFRTVAAGYIPSPLFRVFRNRKGVEFHGIIHELVGESVSRLKLSSKVTDIPIYHYGWIGTGRTEEEKSRKKAAYSEMIRKAWEADRSPKMAFYYIKSLEDPREKIKLAFRMSKEYPDVKQFWEILAQNAAQLGQWARGLSYVEKGLIHHPGNTVLLATQVRCLNETAQPQKALEIVETLLKADRGNPVYWFEKFRSLVLLGRGEEARSLVRLSPHHFPPDLAMELEMLN